MGRKIRWGRLFRRAAALFLATLAVWGLPLCTGAGAADTGRQSWRGVARASATCWQRLWGSGLAPSPAR